MLNLNRALNFLNGRRGHSLFLLSHSVLQRLNTANWQSPVTMLYLVGLGLADETDITVKGLEIVKRAERVYLEAYTAILMVPKETLVSLFAP